eukprot:sb/3472078/
MFRNDRTPIYRDARGKGFCPVNRGARYIGVKDRYLPKSGEVFPPGKSGAGTCSTIKPPILGSHELDLDFNRCATSILHIHVFRYQIPQEDVHCASSTNHTIVLKVQHMHVTQTVPLRTVFENRFSTASDAAENFTNAGTRFAVLLGSKCCCITMLSYSTSDTAKVRWSFVDC